LTALALAFALAQEPQIGLRVGGYVPPFEPVHVTGPYKGTRMCPVCEWSTSPMVFVWVNGADEGRVRPIVAAVQAAVVEAGEGRVRAFLIDANAEGKDSETANRLEAWSESWATSEVYAMYRPSSLQTTLRNYRLDALDRWRVIAQTVRKRRVVASWPDPRAEDLPAIREAVLALAG
jgi:hypothetical protein